MTGHRERQAPPSVVYELTPLGRSFHDGPLQALADWALEHGEALLDPGSGDSES